MSGENSNKFHIRRWLASKARRWPRCPYSTPSTPSDPSWGPPLQLRVMTYLNCGYFYLTGTCQQCSGVFSLAQQSHCLFFKPRPWTAPGPLWQNLRYSIFIIIICIIHKKYLNKILALKDINLLGNKLYIKR